MRLVQTLPLLFLAVGIGCNNNSNSQQNATSNQKDPVEQFEVLVRRFDQSIFEHDKIGGEVGWYRKNLREPISYDVRKTESLISPFEGEIYLKITPWISENLDDDITLRFAWQNEKWVYQSGWFKRIYNGRVTIDQTMQLEIVDDFCRSIDDN